MNPDKADKTLVRCTLPGAKTSTDKAKSNHEMPVLSARGNPGASTSTLGKKEDTWNSKWQVLYTLCIKLGPDSRILSLQCLRNDIKHLYSVLVNIKKIE